MFETTVYQLGELVNMHDAGRVPIRSSERIAGATPYYGASGIVDWVDGHTHDGCYLLISEDGENLRSRSTPIAFSVNGTFWANNHVHVVSERAPGDVRFLQYALAVTDLTGYLTGSAQPKLSSTALRSIRLTLPPHSTRQAIAEVLGSLDDKIAANDRAARIAQDLSFAILRGAAEDGERVRLRDCVNLLTRGVTPKYTEEQAGMLVLNQKCVRNRSISLAPARRMVPLTTRLDRILRRNDVLVNSTGYGTLGRAARWSRDETATIDTHITLVRFDDALVDPICAGTALVLRDHAIEMLAEGSTGQTELKRELLGGIELTLPARTHQKRIGQRIDDLSDVCIQLDAESRVLAATRDELLPLLMSGKVRVRDAEKIVEEAV